MYPREVGYFRPSTIEEALKFLEKEKDSRPLAGGQSLIPMMRLRVANPSYLVDLTPLNMNGFNLSDNEVRIGATTKYSEILSRTELRKATPLLVKALSQVGDSQVRNMGTLGGSVCNADPASDSPAVLLAAEARFVVKSVNGEREVKASDFFKGPFTTQLKQGEILREIKIPTHADYKTTYVKLVRRAGDYAIVSAAVMLKMKGEEVEDVRLSYASAADRPYRAKEAEEFLKGRKLNEENLREAAELALKGASPPSDVRASSSYRKELIKLVTMRGLRGAS
ncbi:carbon monoxide dehydrogenase [Sulfodiicoccus acidiphilus]|uniref:Carbon monoxide dehydrogenase n=1 Tax=Sulfodiicoccus acidiphilus TaxID=1670455 RepID=A0A348B3V5_9CREN|nr:glyceraldehyde dehydrogenase subunit beta [Sulfodiicoccus acidiphilus]BBD72857.1 carbon monoxide dehydrogenase [Sulfodiicoccus acidiphilus]GGT88439.1 carbon monoxide dehydrogenase [Sulfodiicoccus acidiphilus]